MLPYLDVPTLGPVNSFGLLVVLGVFVGSTAAYRHGERLGLDQDRVRRLALSCGICGLIGAHVMDVVLYQPGWVSQQGAVWTLLNPFGGISSMGGVIGGTFGFVLFGHLTGLRRLEFADTAALGLLVLLTFGRAGCASVHDHIGVATQFPLAVDFPTSNPGHVVGPHHDLGLYEFGLLLVLLGVAAVIMRKPKRPGLLVGLLAVCYAPPRFLLDFLRRPTSDPRYGGLTPAQWSTLAMFIAGATVLWVVYRRNQRPPRHYLRATPWRTYLADALRPGLRSASAAARK